MQNSLADSNRVTNRNYVIVNPLLHFTDVELLCRNVVNKSLLLFLLLLLLLLKVVDHIL